MLLQAPGATSDSAASEDIATLRGPIQAALDRSGFELSFPKQLEDLFQRDTQAARCRYIATAALIGVIVYDLLAYSDYRLLPDVFNMALLVRFAFITPLVFVCVAIIGRHPPPVARETMAAVMVT